MAAGRVDVSRRRGINGYDSNHFNPYKNGEHGVGYKNGYHNSSSSRNIISGRNRVSSCREIEREFREFRPRYGLEDGEIPSSEDGIQLPLEKKRKFSPVIWDVEDKVALMQKAVTTSGTIKIATNSVASEEAAPAELEPVSDEGCRTASPFDANGSGSLSPAMLSFFCQEKNETDDQNQTQGLEEEEFAEARHISMSRWASDSDSPTNANLSDDEGAPGETICRKESIGQDSSDDRLPSSKSIERGCSSGSSDPLEDSENTIINEDLMDVDRIKDGNDDAKQMDDSCCQVEGSGVADGRSFDMLEGCRSVYEYERLNEINEGTYGKVYKGLDKKTGQHVALKKVKLDVRKDKSLEEYGFPITSLREINILLSFQHPSIVNVKEVVVGGLDSVYMVMEYMEHDLKGFMQARKHPFSTSEVKCLMLQLLEGVKYLHDNWVLHRDLKTSNLLLNNEGDLKICDFGMSRQYGSPLKPYTSLVVTLWYRAPELLLGSKQYSTAIDMWSVGCIMAEMLSKEPLFKGNNEINQLSKIFGILGTPNEGIWPGFSKLPGAKANFIKQPYNFLRKKFPATSFTGAPYLSDLGLDLLTRLLTYDPEKRLTVDEALNHGWFCEVPLATCKELMPTLPPQHAKNRIVSLNRKRIDSCNLVGDNSFLY
ncbi:cyclin-dependent kinase G-2 [Mercurialis annua]|uniref:cyclin-dependent kinase G-2 n=1 Tax=Mercurialis annua TaxID=3986 RepID=UPI00215F6B54|nr:cyclin-dependent kinase G-2 [Mercurialis annua]XP_050222888.1 cyclin-dependent kinase G-2 [Mercurialis annua]XP_050222889.1 cyclin-dependent kinase G-2 [Mercurialis annua]XP_050222890.1 cyclin-dependent kinase G-2 [Mercurialis annua]XP_050222891.1 cyclin-dependent kinase G-2 [Mercurialis annua]XP_050222892.1 cyclin-dependent kinase G-2 [Mercurialis annua]XP_050222893.1 cyclin-dependent kinase G-2 [Mercurialis annua]XP_050222895.1 cyclin-dependent kinase G-2 [Mercurialis annua]XP_05022289